MLRKRLLRLLLAMVVTATATFALNTAVAGPAAADGCYTWSRTLSEGMSGSDVTQLQIRVAGWPGSYGEVIAIDGQFGPRTAAAVRRFQQAYGLNVDGIAGPQTFGKIYDLQDSDCSPVHFSFTEVTRSDTCGSQLPYVTSGVRANLVRVMWRAEALRHQLGDRPLVVSSGFRTKACNDLIKGAKYSQHLYGRALDLIGTPSLCTLARGARSAGFNGIVGPGAPDHNDHTHLDIRSSRYWNAPNCF